MTFNWVEIWGNFCQPKCCNLQRPIFKNIGLNKGFYVRALKPILKRPLKRFPIPWSMGHDTTLGTWLWWEHMTLKQPIHLPTLGH